MVYIFPSLSSLAFFCRNTNKVEVKLLVQPCISFTDEQIGVTVMSIFVVTATTKVVKDTLFLTVWG